MEEKQLIEKLEKKAKYYGERQKLLEAWKYLEVKAFFGEDEAYSDSFIRRWNQKIKYCNRTIFNLLFDAQYENIISKNQYNRIYEIYRENCKGYRDLDRSECFKLASKMKIDLPNI